MRKLVEITWKDHFSESSWRGADEIQDWVDKHKSKRCTTTGVIVYEDKDVIVMSASDDGDGNYGDLMAIYKNHIVKRRRL